MRFQEGSPAAVHDHCKKLISARLAPMFRMSKKTVRVSYEDTTVEMEFDSAILIGVLAHVAVHAADARMILNVAEAQSSVQLAVGRLKRIPEKVIAQ